jgi:hypothetical protein
MSDRHYFYFKQRVTDDELRTAADDPEFALWNLAIDLGVFGISEGGDVDEQDPVVGLYVDISGPFVGYTQEGKRVYFGTDVALDCSTDYLSNPTVPTSVGEKRWISIHARFDRALSDQRTDGNGAVVYWVQAESYELRIVSGTAATGGSHTKPDLPTDAILVADVELEYGQTTILDANIDETRKNTLVLATAATVSVSAGAWTEIDSSSQDVQDALDSIDGLLISTDSVSGRIDQALIPHASATDLGSATYQWDAFLNDVSLYGTLTVDAAALISGALIPDSDDAYNLGGPGARWSTFRATSAYLGELTISSGGSIIPAATGQDIGTSGARWDAYIEAGLVYGSLKPNATGVDIGDASTRFDAFLENVTVYGYLYPGSNGLALGDSTGNKWTGNFEDLYVKGSEFGLDATARVVTDLISTSTGENLGSSANRWGAFYGTSFDVTGNGKIGGNLDMDNGTINNAGQINIDNGGGLAIETAETAYKTYNHDAFHSEGDTIWSATTDYFGTTANEGELMAMLDLPDGAQVTTVEVYWYQATNDTTDMLMTFEKRVWNAISWSSIGTVNIDTFGTTTTDSITSLTETIARDTTAYRIRITSAGPGGYTCQLRAIRVTYTIADLKAAILAQ